MVTTMEKPATPARMAHAVEHVSPVAPVRTVSVGEIGSGNRAANAGEIGSGNATANAGEGGFGNGTINVDQNNPGQNGSPAPYISEGSGQIALELVPSGPVAFEDVEIRLALLPAVIPTHEYDYITQQLQDGWPLEHPLTLQRWKGGYRVLDGIHRLCALRAARMETAPARIYAEDVDVAQVLTLALNNSRKPNPVAELDAIQSLLGQGYCMEEIARHTGMPQSRVLQRLQLAGMDPALMALFRQGCLSVGVAEKTAKLPLPRQADLAKLAAKRQEDGASAGDGTARKPLITAADVLKVQAGDRAVVVQLLGEEIVARGTVRTWREDLRDKVEECVRMLPDTAPPKIVDLLGRLRLLVNP